MTTNPELTSIYRRLDNVEETVKELEAKHIQMDKLTAIEIERWKTMDARLKSIEDLQRWILRTTVGAGLTIVVVFAMSGGFGLGVQ